MHVDVIISTYDRLELLKKCIKSIVESDYKEVSIVVAIDGNEGMLKSLVSEPITAVFNLQRIDCVASLNKLVPLCKKGAILYAADDLEFRPDCISQLVARLREHFPDSDGMIGLQQYCEEKGFFGSKGAFALMGRKFVDRFPNGQIFCPDYIHFNSDTELKSFAQRNNLFHFCSGAIVHHSRLQDRTYALGEKVTAQDRNMLKVRHEGGYLWGESFEVVSK